MISGSDSRGSCAHPIVLHLELRYISLSRCHLGVFPLMHEALNIALKIRSSDNHGIILIRRAGYWQMPVHLEGLISVSVISSRRSLRLNEFLELQVTEITRKSIGSWTRGLRHLFAMLDYVSVRLILSSCHSFECWQVVFSIGIIIRKVGSRPRDLFLVAKLVLIESTLCRTEICSLAIWKSWQRVDTSARKFNTKSVWAWTRCILLNGYSCRILNH